MAEPTTESLFLEWGLYDPIDLRFVALKGNVPNLWKKVIELEFYTAPLDTFCIECKSLATFRRSGRLPIILPTGEQQARRATTTDETIAAQAIVTDAGKPTEPKLYAKVQRNYDVRFECSRDAAHEIIYYFRVADLKLTKIGQYPSLADIQIGQLKDYRRVLTDDQSREFTKAIGLFAHGVGIGSFVYLRRLFEQLIDGAHAAAAAKPQWNEDTYARSRMDEKIQLLRDELPDFLVENRNVYGILSKGIHELGEDECKQYFEPVKSAIELILEEKLDKLKREDKIAETRNAIAKITGKLKT